MSQQPPEWWSRQRGPRLGCADVTIVSIASITAFVILIFVLFRPDFARVLDVTNRNGEITVSAVRPTETPAPSRVAGVGAAAGVTDTTKAPVPPTPFPATATPVPEPTPTFRQAVTRDDCRLREDTSYEAVIIKTFKSGSPFKVYNEQRYDEKDKVTFLRVEPDDNSKVMGWMVSTCF